jgi:hypothetical protein
MLALMARIALLLIAVLTAGCPAGGDDDYPIGGGGGGGGGTTPQPDAGGGGGGDGGVDGQVLIGGRVCLLSDLRRLVNMTPGDCAATGANGIRVALGDSMPVLTGADGSFSIPTQAGTNLVWQVSRLNLMTSIVPVSTSTLLPAISDVAYGELLSANGVVVDQNEGGIVARIIRNGGPLMGATARINGGESLQTLYDAGSATVWGTLGTGALGVAWLPDNAAGGRTLNVQGQSTLSVPVTITAQAITFVTIAVP